ncbi:Murein DD-endopeptidase MepM and murein hydrolase activator NlpD, contain LysM domain [Caminicella sporogenes DSM 14501]|uniref:Murein DD-endopeptidase MepM and murein hydrolase activator NlpD, contain LysM domain n=1 Tax=Caminicella sporogenes DSM 14501 TaxID=1121266 RepID=A0A1M6PUZ3_9FIRM|nr:M23 family metallopeptidase [Caminicella sporogenes]RKD21964.1 hypothetical protein BET04_06855 [Caminicella sporogenes]SHK11702.1 Murein DD-endopeptidase MepM and murein hydrolase activator NlpD, contain LysM domain [Caminicella sporogenes DSM 14501]
MKFKKIFTRNNNTIYNGSKGIWNKLLKNEGFYIIMFLCVCIVGTTAVWVAKSNFNKLGSDDFKSDKENIVGIDDSEIVDLAEDEMKKQMSDVIVVDEKDMVNNDKTVQKDANHDKKDATTMPKKTIKKSKILVKKNEKQKAIIAKIKPDKKNIDKEATMASSQSAIAMIWPVEGKLGTGFALETLVYSETLEHFTTHHGIDIMAEKNTPVKAALKGEVVEVLTDSRLGITISIKHDNGLITRYSNLCTDAMVKVGDKVAQGQTISGVGTSSLFESAQGPHLHFEVLENGKNVDPMKYLSQKE